MNIKKLVLLFVFISLLFPTALLAETADSLPKKLQVGIAGTEPFVFAEENAGISAEIWDKIAAEKSWDYTYVPYDNVDKALQALDQGAVDLVVGPVSVTAKRLENMQFSQPFYNSSISIISRSDNPTIWQTIRPLFSIELLMAIGVFLIILAFVGVILWLAERKESPDQFPQDPMKGIGTGMWLAIVTMSTTGYGDKAPITLLGRIAAGSWMIISIIFATTMIAGISSNLTLSNIESSTISTIEQLSDKQTATLIGSSSAEVLKSSKTTLVLVKSLEEAIEKLENKEVEAVVYDRPQLLYYFKDKNKKNLYISKAAYFKQGYGFAFSIHSPLTLEVDRALIELAENQEVESIIHQYIQKDE